jgi:hypothetical protein
MFTLYGVTVVDDGIDGLGPRDVQRSKLRLDGLADVDWRLLAADGAGAIGGIEVAPFRRAVAPFIAPMRVGGEAARSAQGTERKPREQFQHLTAMHGALLTAASVQLLPDRRTICRGTRRTLPAPDRLNP